VASGGIDRPVFSDAVIDAPLDLPDGIYKLVVDDKVYTTEKCQGWWHMVNLDAGV
jgi:hypothetical protein